VAAPGWDLAGRAPWRRGQRAEARACWYLRLRGWRIVARNWIGGGGELDIVASRWRTLLVVEVRARSGDRPLASIDRDKLRRCAAAAQALVRTHHLQRYRLRLDVIGIDERGRLRRQRDVLERGWAGW